ncbi:MAG: magnesium transporter [Clostridiales bacterium]|nr:magnesium transporter [Clostridiales bacterium]
MNFVQVIEALWDEKKINTLRELLLTMQPAQIAEILDELSHLTTTVLFRMLPKEVAADVFIEMEPEGQEALVKTFSDSELQEVIDDLFVDDAVNLIEEMPANVVRRIIANTDPQMRASINNILKYPKDSAGSIMTVEYVSLAANVTADQAIELIRTKGTEKRTVNVCYITDSWRHLLGVVSLYDIIRAPGDAIMEHIMEDRVVSIQTQEDQETVAHLLGKYDFNVMPVVDTENRLVGIITADDVIDVIQEETTEDMEKMAAIMPSEKPYLRNSIFELWKSRIPWLLILMISATFTGMIITGFQEALAASVVLTAFIPMLMDSGGNAGSQSSVTIIRGLSLKQISFKELWEVVWKESRVGILCGLTLSASTFVKLLLIDRLVLGNDAVTLMVALVVSLTMAITIFIAKVTGSILPLLAEKIGFDPAVMASPFITTIVDALSLLVYFGLATQLLGI